MKTNEKYFLWHGKSSKSEHITGIINAKDKIHAKIFLIHNNITPIKIKKYSLIFLKNKFKKLTTYFLRQLATLIESGIPIVQACKTLASSQSQPFLKYIINNLTQELERGNNLSYELYKYPNFFDYYTCHLVKLGEQSGSLAKTISLAAQYNEKSLTLQNTIKQALFYPIIVTSVSMIITAIMLIFIVPQFAILFQNAHQHLPKFTQFIINISNTIRNYYWLLIFPIIIFTYLFYHQTYSLRLKTPLNRALFSIPILKTISHKLFLTRFCRSLAISFDAGTNLIDALQLTESLTKNIIYKKSILQLQQQVISGMQLNTAMKNANHYPLLMIEMTKVGEESGKLSTMLEKIAIIYESDINNFIHIFKQLLEPLIILILGVLIGGIVIAMYLPVFKLGTVV